jgi:hypothetical protein
MFTLKKERVSLFVFPMNVSEIAKLYFVREGLVVMIAIRRTRADGKRIVTVFQGSRNTTIQIKPVCCEKFREPEKGKCTGCPWLNEQERMDRLIRRMNGGGGK